MPTVDNDFALTYRAGPKHAPWCRARWWQLHNCRAGGGDAFGSHVAPKPM